MPAFGFDWYADASRDIDAIYREELNRPPDFGGWANWLCHMREYGREAAWIRDQIRESEEWKVVHAAPPPVTVLSRVVPNGVFFRVDTERHTVIECTDFQLFQRFLVGQDIEPVLAQRQALGFNTLRVLGMCELMFQFHPQAHDNYHEKLYEFAGLCAQHGLYIEFTVFADATVVMPDPEKQIAFWYDVGFTVSSLTNVRLELVNEENQPINKLECRDQVLAIHGVLCSHGSNGSEARPVRPAWDYETIHYNDAFEWQRKVGHNSMEDGSNFSRVPAVANENTRPDRDSNVNRFYDAAAGAALLCAGSCFHSQEGKASVLFAASLPYAQAWADGARSVPLAFQDGQYFRRDDIFNAEPNVLRAYERRLPDGTGFVVRIRR